VIDKGIPTAGPAGTGASGKVPDHQPLHRQEDFFESVNFSGLPHCTGWTHPNARGKGASGDSLAIGSHPNTEKLLRATEPHSSGNLQSSLGAAATHKRCNAARDRPEETTKQSATPCPHMVD